MNLENQDRDIPTPATDSAPEASDAGRVEWITPDFVEHSTCAEICAYVYTA